MELKVGAMKGGCSDAWRGKDLQIAFLLKGHAQVEVGVGEAVGVQGDGGAVRGDGRRIVCEALVGHGHVVMVARAGEEFEGLRERGRERRREGREEGAKERKRGGKQDPATTGPPGE